jgi:hypothetical protein
VADVLQELGEILAGIARAAGGAAAVGGVVEALDGALLGKRAGVGGDAEV